MSAALRPRSSQGPRRWTAYARAGAIVLLVLVQLTVLDRNYGFTRAIAGDPDLAWTLANRFLKITAYAILFGALAFALIVIGRARQLVSQWRAAAAQDEWRPWLALNLVAFAALTAALPYFQIAHTGPPWAALAAWLGGCAIMLAAAIRACAPAWFWRTLLAAHASYAAGALLAGALIFGAINLGSDSWSLLSNATLHAAFAMLSLYEPGAALDAPARVLSIGAFNIRIDSACSGYEGMGLVLTTLSLFLVAFRQHLRFPNALLLLPIGLGAIWIANVIRIALLVSIGAHVSPDVAMNGFHAQAGWIMFLAVSIGLMALAYRSPLFRRDLAPTKRNAAVGLALAMLAPFAALMAARILGAMGGPAMHWPSVLAVAAPAAALLIFRARLRPMFGSFQFEPVLIGLGIGALWIVTEPHQGDSTLGAWLASQSPASAAAWIALRVFGFALIVPLAEELAFRGYLHRALARRDFEAAPPAAFSGAAFLVTSLLFGAMHGRWLAGALSGAAFAVTLYRSKSLTGPVLAHVAANGAIAACAIATSQWALL